MRSSERPSMRLHSSKPLPNLRKVPSYETVVPVLELIGECGIERHVPASERKTHGMIDKERWCGLTLRQRKWTRMTRRLRKVETTALSPRVHPRRQVMTELAHVLERGSRGCRAATTNVRADPLVDARAQARTEKCPCTTLFSSLEASAHPGQQIHFSGNVMSSTSPVAEVHWGVHADGGRD